MDMDGASYLRFILALVLVLGLLALAAFLLRRSGLGPKLGRGGRRLSIVESTSLSPRHRLLLIRRDNVEHLLLLGPQGDVVVESGITAGAATGNATSSTTRRFAEMVEPPQHMPAPTAARPPSATE